MSAFIYGIGLQWKTDLRNNSAFVAFYAVPVLFFFVFGGVFTSIMPDGRETLAATMISFAVSMAALIGVPQGICEMYRKEIWSTYHVYGIPNWQNLLQAEIAAFLHLVVLTAIIWISSLVVFNAEPPASSAAFLTGTLLLILSTLGLSGIIGLAARNQSALAAISTAAFLPSILLSGIMFPADMLPDALRRAGEVFPVTWAYRLMCSTHITWQDMWPLLLIMGAGAGGITAMLHFKDSGCA